MIIDSNSALIDNDFLNHALDMKKSDEEVILIISEIFHELSVEPAIHPLVLENEVLEKHKASRIFSEKIIKTPTLDDIHENNEAKQLYYANMVQELYKKFTGSELDLRGETVFTFWCRQASLGEIHSLATCLLCGCGIFLSDDKDSLILKRIIEENFLVQIIVHNRQAVVDELRARDSTLSRKDLRALAHVI